MKVQVGIPDAKTVILTAKEKAPAKGKGQVPERASGGAGLASRSNRLVWARLHGKLQSAQLSDEASWHVYGAPLFRYPMMGGGAVAYLVGQPAGGFKGYSYYALRRLCGEVAQGGVGLGPDGNLTISVWAMRFITAVGTIWRSHVRVGGVTYPSKKSRKSDCYWVRGNIEGNSFSPTFLGSVVSSPRPQDYVQVYLILRWGHCYKWRFARCSLKPFSIFFETSPAVSIQWATRNSTVTSPLHSIIPLTLQESIPSINQSLSLVRLGAKQHPYPSPQKNNICDQIFYGKWPGF